MSQYETLRRIISETLCVPLRLVTSDALLYPDLGVSLDLVEMILACEEEFGIFIPDEDTAQIATVGELAAYIARKTQERAE